MSNNADVKLKNAVEIIEKFGGIRPMASKMDVPVTTVQGWKKRNAIPKNRVGDVIKAAKHYDIDLNDVSQNATANENGKPFQKEMDRAENEVSESKARQHEKAIDDARKTEASASADPYANLKDEDDFLKADPASQNAVIKEIKTAEKRAIQKSTVATLILIGLTAGVGLLLLWPAQERIDKQEQRLENIEQKANEAVEQQSRFKGLLPDNLEGRLSDLQEKTQKIQQQVEEVSQRAKIIREGVLAEDAGTMAERLEVLEQQVAEMTGDDGNLLAVIQRVKALEQSVQGQDQLLSSFSDLQGLVSTMKAEDTTIEGALAEAQQEDDALAQTLEGVSQSDLKAAALLIGLTKFRSSLHRSAPLEEDLEVLKGLLKDDNPELLASLDTLSANAERGILTPEGLSGEFRGLAGDIVVSSLKGEDITVQEKAKARLNNLLQVEKDGELVTGTDTQAAVAKAQKLLDEGDVQGAMTTLQALEGPAADTAQPWIEEAQKTLAAQEVQELLTNTILSKVQNSSALSRFTSSISGVAGGAGASGAALDGIDVDALSGGVTGGMGTLPNGVPFNFNDIASQVKTLGTQLGKGSGKVHTNEGAGINILIQDNKTSGPDLNKANPFQDLSLPE